MDFNEIRFNKNIMYQYMSVLNGTSKYIKCDSTITVHGIPYHCNTILIWFVFYLVLDCKTLEEAMSMYRRNQSKIDEYFKIYILLKNNTFMFPKYMSQFRKIRYVLEFFYDEEKGIQHYQDLILSSSIYEKVFYEEASDVSTQSVMID